MNIFEVLILRKKPGQLLLTGIVGEQLSFKKILLYD